MERGYPQEGMISLKWKGSTPSEEQDHSKKAAPITSKKSTGSTQVGRRITARSEQDQLKEGQRINPNGEKNHPKKATHITSKKGTGSSQVKRRITPRREKHQPVAKESRYMYMYIYML